MKKQAKKTNEQKDKSGARGLLFMAAVVAFSVLFVFFVARPAVVYGPSMEPGLHEGDLLLVWQLGYQPAPGDVVVTQRNQNFDTRLVKRVIAVAGQHLVIQNGVVRLDGEPLDEPYVPEAWNGNDLDLVLPEGSVFLMGDNRNHSRDSREIGPVNRSQVMGKVVLHS